MAKNAEMETPFAPFLRFCRVFGGFPLSLKGKEYDSLLDYFLPLVIPSLCFIFSIINIILTFNQLDHIEGNGLDKFFNYVRYETDASLTDALLCFANTFMVSFSALTLFPVFITKRDQIREVYKLFQQTRLRILSRVDSSEEGLMKKLTLKDHLMFICATFAFTTGASYFWGKFILTCHPDPRTLEKAITITYALFAYFTSISPHFSAATFMIMDLASVWDNTMTFWIAKVQHLTEEKLKKRQGKSDEEILYECKLLRNLALKLDEMLAPFCLIVHTQLLFGGVFCMYGSTSYITKAYTTDGDDDNGEPKKQLLHLAMYYFFLFSFLYLGAIYKFGRIGSRLIQRGIDASKELNDMSTLSKDLSFKHDITLAAKELKEACILKPFGAFEISNANGVAMINTLVTFTLVTMQFRIGEST